MATITEDLTAQVDGVQTVFTVSQAITAGTLSVWLSGIKQRSGQFFTETPTGFTTSEAPEVGDELQAQYENNVGDVIGFTAVTASGIDPSQP